MNLLDEARQVLTQADCLHPESDVRRALDRLGTEITRDYEDKNPLVLCVMNGGLYATSEVTRRLKFPLTIDYLHATRYRGSTTGGGLVWKRQLDGSALQGHHLLVIDDILDEGHTLLAIRRSLAEFDPASLRVAVLVDKQHDRRVEGVKAEYIGLTVADRYVFGCGMDYKEYWRQLPAVYAVAENT